MQQQTIRTVRSHTCGELNEKNLDQSVSLCGWVSKRRDHGGLVFIDLRDRYGVTQIVFDPKIKGGETAHQLAAQLRSEYVIFCKGNVRARPDGMKNEKLKTGTIEIAITELVILSEAKTPPFELEDETLVAETTRLKYRYLDLRRPVLQKHLVVRHQMLSVMRRHLDENLFVEVETPILYKSTPEGARDFIVPSRLNPGNFYALPQSPQTLKQLLMISGLDRYYQIARCFRDEDLRADRQPEFSQVDIEVSFMDEQAFFPLIEQMIAKVWKEVLGKTLESPFKQITYAESMDRYGSDKPDVRFGLELQDVSAIFEKSEFQVFKAALTPNSRGMLGSIRVLNVQGQAEKFSRKDLDDLQSHAAAHGAKGLLWIKVQPDGTLQGPSVKFFTEEEKSALKSKLNLKPQDLVLGVADQKSKRACEVLGAIRLKVGERLKLIPSHLESEPAFLWVTDFPLMEYDDTEKRYFACHHPFTSPKPECFDDFVQGKNLDQLKASAYDLVLNGVEIAGGSLRIYRNDVQKAMFNHLGLTEDEAKLKFGFFLDALQFGTPPHGGIAFGIERLAMILRGTNAIRDVMAFPKTQKGTCLMSESPSEVSDLQLKELAIKVNSTV